MAFKISIPTKITNSLLIQEEEKTDSPVQSAMRKKSKANLRKDISLVKLLRTAVEQTSEDDGLAHMSRVGHYISNNKSFSSINYG